MFDTDAASRELLRILPHTQGTCLWLADEHHGALIPELAILSASAPITLLSNRFDLHRQAIAAGLTAHFNDWQIPRQQQWQHIFLKVCKERSVNHHLIQQAFSRLALDGQLWLAGEKSTGIKTYAKQAGQLFGQTPALQKNGSAYHCGLRKTSGQALTQLNTQDYNQLRAIATLNELPVVSKPGVYGWQKIDAGSALLMQQFLSWHAQRAPSAKSLLDLGCGYGYLTLASTSLSLSRRCATDNNAAALICMTANAEAHGLEVEVVPGDCGDTMTERFDLILCNPPFHTGFATDSSLLERFLAAAQARLNPGGHAFFVVNSFLPLEKTARKWFRQQQLLRDNRQFKVFVLSV